ncbi:MAG: flagellar hook-basal body complex protein FliE [Planctomycetes bacterium]|nr:flagellar hook-basal body complex protein FliE [Planctomycetota bacterium]
MNPINGNLAPMSIPGQYSGMSTAMETSSGGSSFKDMLLGSIHQVNSMQQAADQAIETMATGGDVNPAEVLTAVQKADIAFRMMMQMRNKLVSIYEEVKNIRV